MATGEEAEDASGLSMADAMRIMREGHERYEARLRARRSDAARRGWATRRQAVAARPSSTPSGATCVVCRERPASGTILCVPCARSFRDVDPTHASVIRWAVDRAMRFESRRQKRVQRLVAKHMVEVEEAAYDAGRESMQASRRRDA